MLKDKSFSSRLLDALVIIVCVVVTVATLYPILYLAALSFSGFDAINRGAVTIYPIDFTLRTYQIIWRGGTIPRSFVNSIYYMLAGTAINMVCTTTIAYSMSKKRLPFKNFFSFLVLIPMFFSDGLIPTFLIVQSYGLYNTTWSMILLGAVSTYNLIIMRTFFAAQPIELEESAFLDGANDLQVFTRIVLPTSQAGIATIALFYMVSHWNSWFNPLIYLADAKKYPLQLVLRNIVIEGQLQQELAAQGQIIDDAYSDASSTAIKYGALFISIVPMIIIYPFIQKYFTKGVMLGSIKG